MVIYFWQERTAIGWLVDIKHIGTGIIRMTIGTEFWVVEAEDKMEDYILLGHSRNMSPADSTKQPACSPAVSGEARWIKNSSMLLTCSGRSWPPLCPQAWLGQDVQSSQLLPNEERYEPAYPPALGTALQEGHHQSQ